MAPPSLSPCNLSVPMTLTILDISFIKMESYALFATAAYLNKRALTLLTVSDSLVSNEETSPEEREKTFTAMMEIALEIA